MAPSRLPSLVMTSSKALLSISPVADFLVISIKDMNALAISLPKRLSGVAGITPLSFSFFSASFS